MTDDWGSAEQELSDEMEYDAFQEEAIYAEDEAVIEPYRPSGFMWPYLLFLRPKIFFTHFVLEASPLLTALAALIYGISGAIDELEERLLRAELKGQGHIFLPLISNWRSYWILCVALGVLSAFFYFWIGGWWYKKRLAFCGAKDADTSLSRRVYLFASQVYAIPGLIYALWETGHYPTPLAARSGSDIGGLVVVICLFWSVYVSYRGVRTAFEVRRWAARFWFMILPGGFCLLGIIAVVVALAVGMAESNPPVLDYPNKLKGASFDLEYPQNWMIDETDEDYDPDHYFSIEAAWADAATTFCFYEEPVDPAVAADELLGNITSVSSILEQQPLEHWGQFQGKGYLLHFKIDDQYVKGLLFVHTANVGAFHVIEMCEESIYEQQRPGFEMIRSGFRFRCP